MKALMLGMVIVAATICFSTPVMAQAPNVAAAQNYNSTNHKDYYPWSVYGSNLSVGNSEVYWRYVSGGTTHLWTESKTVNKSSYWYESSSQINFYFTTGPAFPLGTSSTGDLWVCDLASGGVCSNHVNWTLNNLP